MSGKSSKKRRHIRRSRPLKSMDRKRYRRAQHVSPVLKATPAAPKISPAVPVTVGTDKPASTPEGV